MKNQVRYEELCRQASEEKDMEKLSVLVKEVNRMLLQDKPFKNEERIIPLESDQA